MVMGQDPGLDRGEASFRPAADIAGEADQSFIKMSICGFLQADAWLTSRTAQPAGQSSAHAGVELMALPPQRIRGLICGRRYAASGSRPHNPVDRRSIRRSIASCSGGPRCWLPRMCRSITK